MCVPLSNTLIISHYVATVCCICVALSNTLMISHYVATVCCICVPLSNTLIISHYVARAQTSSQILSLYCLQVQDQITSQLNNMIINYRDDPDLQNLVDWVQKDWVSVEPSVS